MKFYLSSTESKNNMNFDIFPVNSNQDLTPTPASKRHVLTFKPFPYSAAPCNSTGSVRIYLCQIYLL